MREVAVLWLLLLATSCGSEDPATRALPVRVAWMPQIDPCDAEADLGLNMTAVLDIGGHNPCLLDVDAVTLEASGDCPEIRIGIERWLGLGYSYTDPASSEEAALAYIIGWVDLRKSAVGNDATIAAPLVPDDVGATQVDTNDERDALPIEEADCDDLVDSAEMNFCMAKVWGKGQLLGKAADFDRDGDTTSNLAEACAGDLF